MIQSRKDLGDGGGVGDHADGSHDLGEISSGNDGRRLVVDSHFESGGAPVNELNCSFGFNGGD